MRRAVVFFIAVIFISASAMAAEASSATIQFHRPVTVNSTVIPGGIYKMIWTGYGEDVQVSFTRQRKVLVTLSARVTQEDNSLLTSRTDDGVVFYTRGGGSSDVLTRIRLRAWSILFDRGSDD